MERAVERLSIISLLVLVLLFVPAGFDGIMSSIAYIIAFVLPFVFGMMWLREDENDEEITPLYDTIDREGLAMTLVLIFPCVLITFAFSYLTTICMGLAGFESSVDVGEDFMRALLMHATIPALLEELVFRYLPLRFIGRRAVLPCIIYSSLLFSLVHHSFFSYVHTFVAGAIFITLDLAVGSVVPSIIIHFANNLLSLLWIFYSGKEGFGQMFLLILVVMTLFSCVAIFFIRRRFSERIAPLFCRGERYKHTVFPLFMALPSIGVAILELL